MEAIEKIISEIKQWQDSQKDQTSGYEYEKSFDLMWRNLGHVVLQNSLGDIPVDKNKKKR